MKKIVLLALAALLLTACKKDNVTAPTITPYITDNYTEDARQLLSRLLRSGAVTTDKDKPELNPAELNKILLNLQAVNNLNTPATDSIFNVIKLHTYPFLNLKYITLQVDKNEATGQKIIAHQPTGNIAFESLMAKYGFAYNGKSNVFSNSAFAGINSPTSYNIPALLAMFKAYPFIVGAEQSGAIGDGSDIEYTLSGNGADINFALKSGDCPAGCIIHHGWKYHVDASYRVTLVARY